jgi:prepilin-type N-terminal cleavage/methylation domain-containing protein
MSSYVARRATRPGNEAGYTLSEVLIAVVILGVAAVTMIGAIASATFASHVHREVVTVDSVMRRYAEQLTEGGYHAGSNPAYADMANPPTGFRGHTVNVECWAIDTNPAQWTPCSNGDNGVQRLTIEASRTDGSRTQTLQIVMRQR